MSIIASRYIQALLELPKNNNIEDELNDIAEVFNTNQEFKKVMLDPRISNNIKLEIVKEIFPQNASKKWFVNFIKVLLQENRIEYIEDIANGYKDVKIAENKELKIKIMSAKPIDEKQIKVITQKFKNLYNANSVIYEIEKDEDLIGGIKVIVGNTIYDGSISTQLKQIF